MLICGDPEHPSTEAETEDTLGNYMRVRDLKQFYLNTDSIATTMYAHPDVKIRYLIKQTQGKATGLDELNFEGPFTWKLQ